MKAADELNHCGTEVFLRNLAIHGTRCNYTCYQFQTCFICLKFWLLNKHIVQEMHIRKWLWGEIIIKQSICQGLNKLGEWWIVHFKQLNIAFEEISYIDMSLSVRVDNISLSILLNISKIQQQWSILWLWLACPVSNTASLVWRHANRASKTGYWWGKIKWQSYIISIHKTIFKNNRVDIERVRITSMEKGTKYFAKINHYLKRENKANEYEKLIYYHICKHICINKIKTMTNVFAPSQTYILSVG